MDFAVCFAKGQNNTKFDKQFRMKGTFQVMAASDGSVTVGNFTPAVPKEENYGFFKGCPR